MTRLLAQFRIPLLLVALALALLLGDWLWRWYTAGQQAACYRQQGIQITQWQVFIGVRPALPVVPIPDGRR